jgi:hypothetical protein
VNIKEYKQKRIKILCQMDELHETNCKRCPTHLEFNRKKKITALTNACKTCEVGLKFAELGQELTKLTSLKKSNAK